MARRGPQYELLQLLLQAGEHGDVPEERLEQLYQEVAPQVRPPTTRARALRASPHLKASDATRLPSTAQILDGPAIENQLSLLNFLPTGTRRASSEISASRRSRRRAPRPDAPATSPRGPPSPPRNLL